MIRSVEFSGGSENPYKIDLVRPDPGSLIIDEIGGLGAGTADLFMSERASLDGDIFNGARLGSRNITFQIGFGHGLDPELGREIAYETLPVKELVRIAINTDLRNVTIDGYVESIEPSIFTNDPSLDVSLVCPYPYFKSVTDNQNLVRLYGLEDLFEFPFGNDSLTEDLLVMGEFKTDRFVELRYSGTVRTGVIVRLMASANIVNPSIYNERTNQTMRINTTTITSMTGKAFGEGDVLEINTIRGQRAITLIRDNKRINMMNSLASISKWIELERGINPISINSDSSVSALQVEIRHDRFYAGL